MPLIRKKTSKRGTTHQRVKIKHKVAESRKKSKKEAKKNTQWKSKHKKDPGIPNNFPYKDQILAEVADQRRQDEEERQRRKELRKAEKAAAKAGGVENDQDQDDASDFDGISSVATSTLKATARTSSAKGKERIAAVVDDDDDAPILLNREYTDLKSVLDKADVVLHVLDARDPLACQSKHLLQYLGEKGHGKTVLVLNKIDTCPRETVQAWAKLLRKQHTTCLFRSASAFLPQMDEQLKSITAKAEAQSTSDALGADALLRAFAVEASKKTDGPLLVAIVGIGNSGKSSLLNSLLQKSVSPVYKLTSTPSGPSTTERPLEVALEHDGKQIHLIDTPALAWERPSDLDGDAAAKLRAQDMLLRNKGRIERAKDPLTPVADIVARASTEDLMLFYTLPAFASGDAGAFLAALARAKGLVKRRGEIDHAGAARVVLRDWSTGRLPRFAHPAPAPAGAGTGATGAHDADADAGLYAADEDVLRAAPLRKEMRRGRGVVRLVPGEVQTRKVALEVPWDAGEDSEDSEEEGGKEGARVEQDEEAEVEDEVEESVEDEEDEEEDEEEEDEEEDDAPTSPPSGKRKRQGKATPAPAPKKVAFAAHPKGSKQARAQPSKAAKAAPARKARKGRK